MKNCLWSCAEY